MAKYTVCDYQSTIRNNGNGCANLYLEVLLQGTSTPSLHQYRIAPIQDIQTLT